MDNDHRQQRRRKKGPSRKRFLFMGFLFLGRLFFYLLRIFIDGP